MFDLIIVSAPELSLDILQVQLFLYKYLLKSL